MPQTLSTTLQRISAWFISVLQGQMLGASSNDPPMPGHAEVLLAAMEVCSFSLQQQQQQRLKQCIALSVKQKRRDVQLCCGIMDIQQLEAACAAACFLP
jgi:hypothetical protein